MRRSLVRAWLALRHRVLDRRYRRLVIENIDEFRLVVLPDVFNPVLFRTGAALGRAVRKIQFAGIKDGACPLALDLGCGTGVGAVFAASRGARAIAVDINPQAVRCARMNARLNHFEDRIEARLGDLFEPVRAERFDLILFNPPFYRGRPRDSLDQAWRGEAVFERFAAGLDRHLAAMGQALVVLSSDGKPQALLDELERNGFAVGVLSQADLTNEVITVYRVLHRPGCGVRPGTLPLASA